MKKEVCPNCRIPLDHLGRCSRCAYPRFTSRISGVLILAAALLSLYACMGFLGCSYGTTHQNKSIGRDEVATNGTVAQPNFKLTPTKQNFPYQVSTPPPPANLTKAVRFGLKHDELKRLLTLFEERDFDALTNELQKLQEGFERDSATEKRVNDSYSIFRSERPDYEELFKDWLAQYPEHFAPYLARGRYYGEKGVSSRGSAYASDTSEEQFQKMQHYFTKSQNDLQTTGTLFISSLALALTRTQ